VTTDQRYNVSVDQIERFVDALFRYADPAGFIQYRCFYDKHEQHRPYGNTPLQPWKSECVGDREAVISTAVSVASAAANDTAARIVFCPPICTFKTPFLGFKSGREEDLLEGLVLSVEIDTASPRAALDRLAGILGVEPTVILHSGGVYENPLTLALEDKLHLHWRLTEPARSPEELEMLKECRRLATYLANGDSSNIPMVHPVRWAGSWHRKNDPAKMAWGEYHADLEVELSEVYELLRDAVPPDVREPKRPASGRRSDEPRRPVGAEDSTTDLDDILAAIAVISNPNRGVVGEHDYNTWKLSIGGAIHHGSNGSAAGLAAFHSFSAKSNKYDARETDVAWRHLTDCPLDDISVGSLFGMALAADPSWRSPSWRRAEAARRAEEQRRAAEAAASEDTSDPRADLIAELALLSPLEYADRRDAMARKLGVNKTLLDELVKAERKKIKAERQQQNTRTSSSGSDDTDMPTKRLEIGSDVEIAKRIAHIDLPATGSEYIFTEGSPYFFNGKVFQEVPPSEFKRQFVEPYDGYAYGTHRGTIRMDERQTKSIYNLVADRLHIADFFERAKIGVAVENGFVGFDPVDGSFRLYPHDPAQRCRTLLPGEWYPALVGSPELPRDSLLHKLLFTYFRYDMEMPEKIALLQEVAGAALIGHRPLLQPKALISHGKGNNGKTEFNNLLQGLVGRRNFSNVPPGDFKDPNVLIQLRGCTLNVTDELGYSDAVQSETFKRVITGQSVIGKILYKDKITFDPGAMNIFATNKLPSFAGGVDHALRRRLMILEFDREIPLMEMVKSIAARIIDEEYQLVLTWALNGAARLIRNREFTIPASSVDALDQWIRDTNLVAAWVRERVRVNPNNRAGYKPSDAIDFFYRWGEESHHDKRYMPKLAEFCSRMADIFPLTCKRTKDSSRLRGIEILTHDIPETADIHDDIRRQSVQPDKANGIMWGVIEQFETEMARQSGDE
jgi:P4 family phage/plasmid primase-like protien